MADKPKFAMVDKQKVAVSSVLDVTVFESSLRTVQVEFRRRTDARVTKTTLLSSSVVTKLFDRLGQVLAVGAVLLEDARDKKDVFLSTSLELDSHRTLQTCTYSGGVYIGLHDVQKSKDTTFTMDLIHWKKLYAKREDVELEMAKVKDCITQEAARRFGEADTPLVSLFKWICVNEDGSITYAAPFWGFDKGHAIKQGKNQLTDMDSLAKMHIVHRLAKAPSLNLLRNVCAGTFQRMSQESPPNNKGEIGAALAYGIAGVLGEMCAILRLPSFNLSKIRIEKFSSEDLEIVELAAAYPEKPLPEIDSFAELIHLSRNIVSRVGEISLPKIV